MANSMHEAESRLRVSRRGFLAASGVGAAMAATGALGAVPFARSVAAAQRGWDAEHDVVVVGSGGAAFAAAITARAMGSDVVMFEKGAYVGGTTLVSGGGMWIPNSKQMQDAGLEDPREDALKYMARHSFPHLFQPDDERLGLSNHDFDMLSAYYDTGSVAMDFIEQAGAAKWTMQEISGNPGQLNVDYQAHFEEDVAKEGRTLAPLDADGNQGGGGLLIQGYQAWAEQHAVPVKLFHRVERVIVNDAGHVIGVEVSVTDPATAGQASNPDTDQSATPEGVIPSATPDLDAATPVATGQMLAIRARKGVVFGSGGFARNDDMMHHLMPAPYYGGCSAPTNEGDFLRISSSVNAKLGNLHQVWRNEGIFEQATANTSAYNCAWYFNGDAFLMVNKEGHRFVNEQRNYQDRPMAHFDWDPNEATWKNLLSFLVYDQRQQENWPGFPIPEDPTTAPYVITGDTLEDLAAAIEERMASLAVVTKGMQLHEDFAVNFVEEVARFNEYATTGQDLDFQRGDFPYDQGWNSMPANLPEWPSEGQPNKTMHPLSDTGPYYAIIMAAAAVDTSGGPVINTNGQILTWDDTPVEGLYGAGNCVACPSVNAYWGGGTTLGHAHVWGYAAGKHAHESAEKAV